MNLATYQPKGSMCMACEYKSHNCHALQFSDMPVIERLMTPDAYNVVIVKCTMFKPPLAPSDLRNAIDQVCGRGAVLSMS
jgi:hypothetical protein